MIVDIFIVSYILYCALCRVRLTGVKRVAQKFNSSSSLPVRLATRGVIWSSSSLVTTNMLQFFKREAFDSVIVMIRRRGFKNLSSSKGINSLRPLF